MPKFIARWNSGYGNDYQIIEAQDREAAKQRAYELWHEAVENNADYGVEEYSRELAQDYDLEEADDD